MKMQKVLKAFSHGLSFPGSHMHVKFQGNSVATNGAEIILPSWLLNAGIEDVEMALGFSTNAMAHYLFKDETAQYALDDVGKAIWAVIDDGRVEQEIMKDRPGTKAFLEPANQKLVSEAVVHKNANLHVLLVLAATKGAIYPVFDDLVALVIKHHANQFGEQLCDNIQAVLGTTLSTTEKTEEIMRLIAENQEASQSSAGSGESQPPQDEESPSSGESSESTDDGESGEESEPSTGNEDAPGDTAPEEEDQAESGSGYESTQNDGPQSSGDSLESEDDGESGEESGPSTGNEDAPGDTTSEDEGQAESESGSESTPEDESPSSGESSESEDDGESGEESEPSAGNEDAPGDTAPEEEGQDGSGSESESTPEDGSPGSGDSLESKDDGESGEESEPSTGNEDAPGDTAPEEEGQDGSGSESESTPEDESPSSGDSLESKDDGESGEKPQPAYTLQSIAEYLDGIGSAQGACMENGQQVTVEILNPSNQRVSVDKGFYDLAASLAESVSRKSTPAKKGKGYALRTSCLPVVSSGINPFGQKRLVYGQSAHYVIAADMSGSMEDLYVRALNTTLSFAQLLQEQGDTTVDVITYYGNYKWEMNDQGNPVKVTPTGISIGMINRLDRIPDIKPDGLTPTAEAIVFAEDILKASPYERRGIIVITDGVPNKPHLDLCRKVERSGIEVYGLGLTEDGFEAVKVNFTRAINAQNGHLAQALLAATA